MGFFLGISICLNIISAIIFFILIKIYRNKLFYKKSIEDIKLFDKDFWLNDNKWFSKYS